MLILAEDGDPLLLVTQESRQVAPVTVIHVAVVSSVTPEQQLFYFLSGVQRQEQTGFFIDGDDCTEREEQAYAISSYFTVKGDVM